MEAAPAQEEVPAGGLDSTLAAKPKWGGGGGGRQRVKSRPNETQAAGSKLQWLKQDGVDLTSEVHTAPPLLTPNGRKYH